MKSLGEVLAHLQVVADDEDEPAAEPRCARCNGAGYVAADVPLGHPDFGEPLPCECLPARLRQRRLKRFLDQGGVPPLYRDWTLQTWNTIATLPAQAAARAVGWIGGEGALLARLPDSPHQERESVIERLLIWGPSGAMKTGLAIGALRHLVEMGPCADARFVSVPELYGRIKDSWNMPSLPREPEIMAPLYEADALVLDNLGLERRSDWTHEGFFRLLDHRYTHKLRTIFTSTLGPTEIRKAYGDEIFWRIIDENGGLAIHLEGVNARDRRSPTREANDGP